MSFGFNSEIAIKAMGNSEKWKNKKSENARTWNAQFFSGLFAMQSTCFKCLTGIGFTSAVIFFVPAFLLILQFFSNKFRLLSQLLNKFLKCLYALERSQPFLPLEKEPFFLNGGLLFRESVYFVYLLFFFFNYFKSIETWSRKQIISRHRLPLNDKWPLSSVGARDKKKCNPRPLVEQCILSSA